MSKRLLLKGAYRVLRPQVSWGLIGLFLVCILLGMLIEKLTGSLRWLFILFALAFLAQTAVFLGARFIPAVRDAVANPGLVQQSESLIFGVGLLSAFVAAFLLFAAVTGS